MDGGFTPLAQVAGTSAISWGGDIPPAAWIVGLVYLGLLAAGVVVDLGLAARWLAHPVDWRGRLSRLAWRPWQGRESSTLVLILMALFMLAVLVEPGIRRGLAADPGSARVASVVLHSLAFHVAGLLLVAFSLRRRGLTWGSGFGLRAGRILKDVGAGIVFYLATMPFLWFYSLLYQLALRSAGYEPTWQEVAEALSADNPFAVRAYLGFLAVVLAPLFEEVLFRGIGLPVLARKFGAAPAVILASALFAAIHFHVPSLVPLFIIAVAFSLAYIHTGSILVPVVMHGLFNAVNVVVMNVLRGS